MQPILIGVHLVVLLAIGGVGRIGPPHRTGTGNDAGPQVAVAALQAVPRLALPLELLGVDEQAVATLDGRAHLPLRHGRPVGHLVVVAIGCLLPERDAELILERGAMSQTGQQAGHQICMLHFATPCAAK